eukprot:174019_1
MNTTGHGNLDDKSFAEPRLMIELDLILLICVFIFQIVILCFWIYKVYIHYIADRISNMIKPELELAQSNSQSNEANVTDIDTTNGKDKNKDGTTSIDVTAKFLTTLQMSTSTIYVILLIIQLYLISHGR